ncbi:MAG: hypothetical protein ABIJ96_18640 [Elusimicrobiota bacterium]
MFLFVFLIFETAKISREKIRHQFAVDSAAFVEMSIYSDFLNRTAYNNGAFPQRVFDLSFRGICMETKTDTAAIPSPYCGAKSANLYDILYKNGAFPSDPGKTKTEQYESIDDEGEWNLRFGENPMFPENRNDSSPSLNDKLYLITEEDAHNYWITWDDAKDIYKLYVQLYQLVGIVEDSQFSVFCRMTGATGCTSSDNRHNYFRKSYWLNTNAGVEDAYDGAQVFNDYSFEPEPNCLKEIMIFGNKATPNAFQPFQVYEPPNAVQMKDTITGCSGLFQMETIDEGQLLDLATPHGDSPHPGIPITQHWDLEGTLLKNYFEVDFHQAVRCQDGGGPCVHATVGISHPAGTGKGVWPNSTPKFQTRLYP